MKDLTDMCLRALVSFLKDHPSASPKAIVGYLLGLGYNKIEINDAVERLYGVEQSNTVH